MRLKTGFISVLFLSLSGVTLAQPEPQRCEDEVAQASAWIQWAASHRAACLVTTHGTNERARCLQDIRVQLSELEQQHTHVYATQIQALHANHPVVKGLISKLKDNVRAAEIAISTDAEPQDIAEFRKQSCMERR